MDLTAFIIGLAVLIPATIQDMRTREVADLLSYSLMYVAIGYGLLQAIFAWSWIPLAQMGLGLALATILSLLMYYTGQWGGADSKLLMGLGALLGLGFGTVDTAAFIVLLLFAGAAYGVVYMLALITRNWHPFLEEFQKYLDKMRKPRMAVLLIVGILVVIAIITSYPLVPATLAIMIYVTFYLWLLVQAAEHAILIKQYPVSKLTEGDWIYKNVTHRGKHLAGPKDLGITKEQIDVLKKHKIKNVWVKEGIPFVPSFLIAFVILYVIQQTIQQLVAML